MLAARGLVGEVYRQIRQDLGIVGEPWALHSPVPTLLAGTWIAYRESLLAGRVARRDKEAVVAAVSRTNRCAYCLDSHTLILNVQGEGAVAEAIRTGHDEGIPNPTVRLRVEWAGATRSPDSDILQVPPFSEEDAPEIIGAAVFFHYLNRMVRTFVQGTPVFPARFGTRPGLVGAHGGECVPGQSLDLLPEAPLPDDCRWATAASRVASAFARFAAAVEAAGADALPGQARRCVQETVRAWRGEDRDKDLTWVEEAVRRLDDRPARAAARLALVVALAPERVDDELIEVFRAEQPGDTPLLAAAAWGSLTAARRIGTWLSPTGHLSAAARRT